MKCDFARVNIASKKNVARYSDILSVLLSTIAMETRLLFKTQENAM